MPSMSHPDARHGRFFELTADEWALVMFATAGGVAVLAALRPEITFWVALGLGLTMVVVAHLCLTARRFVAFPDLIVAAACLQWIVAPWFAEMYPANLPVFRMALPPDEYLPYAVTATLALWVGLYLPATRRLGSAWVMPEVEPLSNYVKHSLDAAIVVGLIVETFEGSMPPQWAFLAYLVASFRFVGALGWMVTQTPGWRIRVAVVLLHLAAVQSTGGLFYLVVHWGGYFLLVYAFMRRWRWRMAIALVVGVFGLLVLQTVKPTFRSSLVEEQVSGPVEAFTRLASMMFERVSQGSVIDPETDVGDTLVRFNQGWIIARIMKHVPAEEPYARGSTVLDAAVFSIVPRFLVPSKREGSSRELFTRFTGVKLMGSTRMGLGIIGELYANFGMWGGIFSTFLYGCSLGWLFLFFAERAQKNPLWWAVASTVLLPGVEPGFNLEDITNHVAKAGVIFVLVWKMVPTAQRLLATPAAIDPGHGRYEDQAPAPAADGVIAEHRFRS